MALSHGGEGDLVSEKNAEWLGMGDSGAGARACARIKSGEGSNGGGKFKFCSW
jgi:hypothetical protein